MVKSSLLLVFTLTLCIQLGAQERWSLEKCIVHALEESLIIKDAELSIENSMINQKVAKSARYPSLNGSSSLSWNFGRSIDPTSNEFITTTFISNGLSLNTGVTLFSGNRVNNTIKQSDIDLRASKKDFEQARNDIALQVATAYLNVLFGQENLSNSIKQLDITMEQLDQTEKLIASGSRPANERLDIEAQVAIREQAVIANENTVDIAMLSLKQLLRLDPDLNMQLDVPENLEVFSDPELLTFSEVYVSALNTQKNVEASELRVASSEVGIKIAKSNLYPSLSFGGSLGTNYSNQGRRIIGTETVRQNQEVFFNDMPVVIGQDVEIPLVDKNPYLDQYDENLSYGFGFNLSIPIYNNFRNKANVEQAKLGAIQSRNNLEQVKDQIKILCNNRLQMQRQLKKAWKHHSEVKWLKKLLIAMHLKDMSLELSIALT